MMTIPLRKVEMIVSYNVEEDVTLTVPLAEDVVVEDVRFMVSELYNMRSKYNPQTENVVVVLPGNRLVVNDFFIESGMQCTMKNGDEIVTGQFISADSKEVGDCHVNHAVDDVQT